MTVAYSNTSVGAPRDRLFAFVTRALKAKALVAGRTMCAFSKTPSNHGGGCRQILLLCTNHEGFATVLSTCETCLGVCSVDP